MRSRRNRRSACCAKAATRIEAMVAAAATIAVVYPHMNSIGGDAFWLIHVPGETPRGIDACGAAACRRTLDLYRERGLDRDTVSRRRWRRTRSRARCPGWSLALDYSKRGARRAASARAPARRCDSLCAARHPGDAQPARDHRGEARRLARPAGIRRDVPRTMATCRASARRSTSRGWRQRSQQLATAGLDDFYRGDLARSIAARSRGVRQPASLRRICATTAPAGASRCHSRTRSARCTTCRRRRRALVSLLILGILDALEIGRDATRQRRLRAPVRRGGEAGVRRARPVHHRPGVHDVDAQDLLSPAAHRRAGRAGRPRRAPRRGARGRGPPIRSGWA